MKKCVFAVKIFLVAVVAVTFCDGVVLSADAETWMPALQEVLRDPTAATDQQLKHIAWEAKDWQMVNHEIQDQHFPDYAAEIPFSEALNPCLDGVERPYITFVPTNYSPEKSWPLIVYLHGGVSRADIIENRMEYVEKNEYVPFAQSNGYLMVFPFAQFEATWWDDVGMRNIMSVLKKTKQRFNIDDDRVYLTGFSDGASASFLFAMTQPTSFAAFVPLNGHMGVGALDGKLPTYAENLSASPLHVINTDIDPLYPSSAIQPMIRMALDVDADIIYREYHGIGHDFDYAAAELPEIFRFFDRHSRDPIPAKINWRSANSDFGQCKWLKINRVSTDDPAPWHQDTNTSLVDDRVSFGFFPDDKYDGKGIKISKLLEGATFSNSIGLKENDIIVQCNDQKIKTMQDLDTFKAGIRRGDSVTVTVKREDEKVALSGKLPDPVTYLLFPREQPSAAVHAQFYANTFVIDSSRLAAFSLFLHPGMIQLDQPVTVVWNGETVFHRKIMPDISFMIQNYLDNRDRKNLYFQRLDFTQKIN